MTLSGVGSERIRVSDVLDFKNWKTVWGIKMIFCFHLSYNKYAILGYHTKTVWGIKFIFYFCRSYRKISCYFRLDPKILLTNEFARFFIFDLLDLLILTSEVHCYIVLVSVVSIVFEKLLNDSRVDHFAKWGLFFLIPVQFQVFSINCRYCGSCLS